MTLINPEEFLTRFAATLAQASAFADDSTAIASVTEKCGHALQTPGSYSKKLRLFSQECLNLFPDRPAGTAYYQNNPNVAFTPAQLAKAKTIPNRKYISALTGFTSTLFTLARQENLVFSDREKENLDFYMYSLIKKLTL